jgi:hypothetical protein
MKSFKVTLSTDGGVALPIVDSSINTENLTYEITDSAAKTVNVTKKYTFMVADKDGLSTSKSITVTSKAVDLIELTQDVGGNPFRVWNVKGPKSGAYDLLLGNNLTVNDPIGDKDIVDSTANTELSAWPARWVCLNTTIFKKVTSKTFGSITTPADLDAAWASSGVEMNLYKGVKKNDVFIFKLRNNAANLVLVGITNVVVTTVDNNDYVEFIYKKKP